MKGEVCEGRKAKLRVGDRVRILSIPDSGNADYFLHPETKQAYKVLIARGRSVRIGRIDEDGLPWFAFRIRRKNGAWEFHSMCIARDDANWVLVNRRKSGDGI
jgi:hypothetical protein